MEVTAIVSATAVIRRQQWNFDIRSAMMNFDRKLLAVAAMKF